MYDQIVIGAGIIGSFTAYHLSKAGYKTLLLEQFTLTHEEGGSHGSSRVIRQGYRERFYSELVAESFKIWADVEKQSGETVLIKCGTVLMDSDEPYEFTKELKSYFDETNTPYKVYSHEEFTKSFPQVDFPEHHKKFMEPNAGMLLASKAKAAVLDLCKRNKTEIIDNCSVESLEPTEELVTVKTSKGIFKAKSVVVCAGIWSKGILSKVGLNIPIQPIRVFVYYFKEKVAGSNSAEHLPCILESTSDVGNHHYTIPSYEYPGYMKVCLHGGVPCSVEDKNDIKENPNFPQLQQFVKQCFPSIDSDSYFMQRCMYAETPDEIGIVDRHPDHKNIIIGTGFSGTGFKKSPAVGRILADLACNKDPKFDLKPLSVTRFKK